MTEATAAEPAGAAAAANDPLAGLTCVVDRSNVRRGFFHYLCVFLWIGWTFFYFILPGLAAFLYFYLPKVFAVMVGIILLSAFTTAEYRKQPKFTRKVGEWMLKHVAEFYHMRVFVEDKPALESSGPGVFGVEPHGVLPLGFCAFFKGYSGFEGHKVMGCVTGIVFKVPLMKHAFCWSTAGSVDKKVMTRVMEKKFSPVICPGGVAECIYLANKKECVLYLKQRAGFVKMAMRFGYPVIPVFTFGLHDLFDFYVPKSTFLQRLGRKIGFLPMFFTGLFGLPLGPGKACDLVNVIGKPISIPCNPNPTDEDVKKYHALYIEEMERIYNSYKAAFGMEDVVLRII